MSDEDWYRGDDWEGAAQERFEAKLKRARKENRPEYLRIKGLYLLESSNPARQTAGVDLLEGLIETYGDDAEQAPVVAGAHEHLASFHAKRGRARLAAEHYRSALAAEAGANVSHGAELSLGALLACTPTVAIDEAEAARTLALADRAPLVSRFEQFTWAHAQARVHATSGDPDVAAAFARGALWLFGHDQGISPRHPDVGLIGEIPRRDYDELVALAAAGDAEASTPLVDEYRRADGSVEWDWNLLRRMTAGDEALAEPPESHWLSFDAAARPVLEELRAAGFDDVFDLAAWGGAKRASSAEVKRAAPILVKWLARAGNLDVRAAVAMALRDPRARKLAALPVLDAFDALDDPEIGSGGVPRTDEIGGQRRLKLALGNAMSSLARDEHFDRLEAIIRNPRHGSDRVYAFWALAYCRSEPVVDLLIELVDDPDIGIDALHGLKSARSERAEPVLRRLASQEPLPRKHPEIDTYSDEFLDLERDHHRRSLEISLGKKGLEKLEAARAAGRSRP